MHKLVLASRNRNKIAELQAMFSDISPEVEILSLDDIGCEGDIVEDGDSYEENSVIKSCVPASKGYIGVADDSGLSVDALDGAPGVYSARYAGAHVTYTDNNEKLLKVMENIDDRGASFVCVMSITVPDSLNISIPEELVDKELSDFASARCGTSVKVVAVRGECRGEILREFRGCDGFGYDPLFLYKPFGKTFAQMSADEKNSVSHRGRAVEKFKAA
ncbi:MAG: non-canonical purine NTP pyrophosphatase, partial [Clostridia bacterium]|nr:non-canonical purine NTP pyrophosphatase [Clostridia bacterium]